MNGNEWPIVIPPYIHQNKDLNETQKILWGRVFGLASAEGYCFASNNFLANVLNKTGRTIQRNLTYLETLGLIRREDIELDDGDTQRRIYPLHVGGVTPVSGGGDTNDTHRCIPSIPEDTKDTSLPVNDTSKQVTKVSLREEEIKLVFLFWVEKRKELNTTDKRMRSPMATDKRIKSIRRRLADGYTVNELREAVVGCLSNPFNVDRGFVDIALICRSPEKVDQYRHWFINKDKFRDEDDQPFERRIIEAAPRVAIELPTWE